MLEVKQPQDAGIWKPLFILLVSIVAIIYAINVFNTGDFFWFQSTAVNIRPDRLRIRHYGTETFVQPGHRDYQQLANVLETSLSRFNNTNLIDIGFGQATLDYYDEQGVILELYYDHPVKFHAPFRTGSPTQILVPIEGRHADNGYFFRGAKGEWWFGAMRMSDSTELHAVLRDLGYLHADTNE